MVGEASSSGGFTPSPQMRQQLAALGMSLAPSAPYKHDDPKQSQIAEETRRARADIDKALEAIDHAMKGASPDNASALNAQKENLAALRAQLQNGFISGNALTQVVQQAQAAASVATNAATTVASGGSIGASAGGLGSMSSERVAAMHQSLYAKDDIYRARTDEISARADARIESSKQGDAKFNAWAKQNGIHLGGNEAIEAAEKKRKDAKARGDVMGERDADVEWNKARLQQTKEALQREQDPDKRTKLEAETAKRQKEFDEALKARDAQAKALMEARQRELDKDPSKTPEQKAAEMKAMKEGLDKSREKLVGNKDVDKVRQEQEQISRNQPREENRNAAVVPQNVTEKIEKPAMQKVTEVENVGRRARVSISVAAVAGTGMQTQTAALKIDEPLKTEAPTMAASAEVKEAAKEAAAPAAAKVTGGQAVPKEKEAESKPAPATQVASATPSTGQARA